MRRATRFGLFRLLRRLKTSIRRSSTTRRGSVRLWTVSWGNRSPSFDYSLTLPAGVEPPPRQVASSAGGGSQLLKGLPVSRMRYDVPPPDLRAESARQPRRGLELSERYGREVRENIPLELSGIGPSMQPLPLPIGRTQSTHPPRHR